MNRQQAFEQHWATAHDVTVESMQQHRWWNQDGYRDPKIAAAYRNFCAGWDASGNRGFLTPEDHANTYINTEAV